MHYCKRCGTEIESGEACDKCWAAAREAYWAARVDSSLTRQPILDAQPDAGGNPPPLSQPSEIGFRLGLFWRVF
jgi:hypothetical protein